MCVGMLHTASCKVICMSVYTFMKQILTFLAASVLRLFFPQTKGIIFLVLTQLY